MTAPAKPTADIHAYLAELEDNSSLGQVLDCYRVIGELAEQLEAQDGWS